MLPIYFVGDWHHKNKNGLQLLKGHRVHPWNGERDGIIFTNELNMNIVNEYDKVIVGPGIDFKQGTEYYKLYKGEKKIIVNVLSPWNIVLHDTYGANSNVTYIALPFPVDIEKFHPLQKKKRFFIYIKLVDSSMIDAIHHMIAQYSELLQEYEYKIFKYGSYQENDYLDYIQSAQFGIWVGRHESQGFALEEALSCDCPLFVYDITSMKDECLDNGTYPWANYPGDLPATAASYFDETCGMICREKGELHNMFLSFFQVLPRFTPRQFVLENLTSKQFMERLDEIIKHTT